ncbi:MAG: hypothetical protein U0Q12_15165 [Vicinamibacterales bacterium]
MSETLMISWIIIVFVAAAHQVFLVNETIFRSMTAAHQALMRGAFEHNCYQNREDCTYDSGDERSKVILDPAVYPEIHIRTVGMFRRFGLRTGLRLTSNSFMSFASLSCKDCKRVRLGAGTYQSPFTTLAWAFRGLLSGGLGFGGIGGFLGGALGELGGDIGLQGMPDIGAGLQDQLGGAQNGLRGAIDTLSINAQSAGLTPP